jgi:eukaryotic-like serine/threonine-protein kinase
MACFRETAPCPRHCRSAGVVPHECVKSHVLRSKVVSRSICADASTTVADREGALATGRQLRPGARIGRYVVEGLLGSGGMGEVYAAWDAVLDRRLALKVLAPARFRTDARTRLLREAQAVARLSHPNVVEVFDAGEAAGVVFMAMELVEGQTLDQWLQQTPRPPRDAILAVMSAAGRGLAAAHRAGIVHRDFKPANVLLARDGARPRVTDFGLAWFADPSWTDLARTPTGEHVTGSPGAQAARLTVTGTVMGTPAYMAPEQHTGATADAAADQFAFCVTLWEALTGRRPYVGATAKILLRAKFGTPRLDTGNGERVPAALRRVVRRGLSARPLDRWPSMDALLAAIERSTRPSRDRIAFAALGLGAVATMGLAGFSSEQLEPCDGRAKLDAAWADRRAEARTAVLDTEVPFAEATWSRVEAILDERGAEWLTDFDVACAAATEETRAHDLRRACLDRRLREHEALVDMLLSADASVVQHAVEAATRLPPIARCSRVFTQRLGELGSQAPGLEEALVRSRALFDAGQVEQAFDAVQRLGAETLHAPVVEARRLLLLGQILRDRGELEEAAARLEDAVWLAQSLGDELTVAGAATWLVFVTGHDLARDDAAGFWKGQAEAAIGRLPDPTNATDQLVDMQALVDLRQGRHERAMRGFERVLASYERRFGEDDLRVAGVLNNLANVQSLAARLEDGERSFERSHAIRERLLGPYHPNTIVTLGNLAMSARARGDLDRAQELLERALEAADRALPPAHPQRGTLIHGLGLVAYGRGNWVLARELYARALDVSEKAFGPDHPIVGMTSNDLGTAAFQLGELEEAHRHYARAHDVFSRAYGPEHPDVAMALANLGMAADAEGDPERALERYAGALAVREHVLGADHPATANTHYNIGELHFRQQRHAEAGTHFEQAARAWEASLGPDHIDLSLALAGIGRVARARDRPGDAVAPLERALQIRQASPGPPFLLAATAFELAQARWDAGEDRERALEVARLAERTFASIDDAESSRGVRHWLTRR